VMIEQTGLNRRPHPSYQKAKIHKLGQMLRLM